MHVDSFSLSNSMGAKMRAEMVPGVSKFLAFEKIKKANL
jgi:hypothetical protein